MKRICIATLLCLLMTSAHSLSTTSSAPSTASAGPTTASSSTTTDPPTTVAAPASTTTPPASTTTPSASTTTPSASTTTPSASTTTPSASTTTPSTSTTTPSASTTTPSASTTTQPASTTTPSASSTTPSASSTTPSASTTTPAASTTTPSVSTTTQSASTTTPSVSTTTPSASTTTPSASTTTPSASTTTPSASTTTPSASTTTPSASSTTPPASTTTPSASTTTPSASTTTPSASTTTPSASTTTPSVSTTTPFSSTTDVSTPPVTTSTATTPPTSIVTTPTPTPSSTLTPTFTASTTVVTTSIWTGPPCGTPPDIANGTWDMFIESNYENAIYTCDATFIIEGNATIECMVNGSWTEPPMCIPDNTTSSTTPWTTPTISVTTTSEPSTSVYTTSTPSVSTTTPSVSTTTPSVSTTTPSASTTTPSVSTTTPSVSTTTPSVSTTSTLSVSTTTPSASTTTPSVSTTTPSVSTTTPSASTTTPSVSTTTPSVSTTTPLVSTNTPSVSTTTPSVSTTTPSVSTTTPSASTTTPSVSTTTPSVSTTTPSASTTTPSVSTTTPSASTTTPSVSTTTPSASTTPSVTTSTVTPTSTSIVTTPTPTPSSTSTPTVTTSTTVVTSSVTPTTPPPIVCVTPPVVANGVMTNGSATFYPGDIVTYTCDSTFILEGNIAISCNDTGDWTDAPTCTPVCPLIDITYGTTQVNNSVVGTILEVSCDTGYSLDGVSVLECNETQKWNETIPSCIIICEAPPVVTNGYLTDGGAAIYLPTAILTYACNDTFVLEGSAVITCNATGNWTSPPLCVSGTTPTSTTPSTTPTPSSGLCYDDYNTNDFLVLTNQDDGCAPKLSSDTNVPYENAKFKHFYVCVNGFISLRSPYNGFSVPESNTAGFQNRYIIAPYMTDLNTNYWGNIYYNLFDTVADPTLSTHPVVLRANQLVEDNYQIANFDAIVTLIATWDEVPAYGGNPQETVTFQVIFTSDGASSYVFFCYKIGAMNIQSWSIFIGQIYGGYASGQPNTLLSQIQVLWSPDYYLCQNGPCSFRVGTAVKNAEVICKTWRKNEQKSRGSYVQDLNSQPTCPCNYIVAIISGQYSISQRNGVFVATYTSWNTPSGHTCTYSNTTFGFIRTGNNVGYYQKFNPFTYPRQNYEEDSYYRTLCCEENNLCNDFYQARPANRHCILRWEIILSFFFGDPHFKTLDGLDYTFNGHAEYIMIDIPSEGFQVQARTGQAISQNGSLSLATIFTGFALVGSNGWVQMELSENRSQVFLYSGANQTHNTDYSSQYESATFEVGPDVPGPTLKKHDKTLSIIIAPGITFNITLGQNLLSSSIALTPNYRDHIVTGLLGNFDGNKDNDLKPRNSNTVLPSTSSESEIFHQFGQTWATEASESIFKYISGKSHADYKHMDFVPGFYDEAPQEKKDQAAIVCGGTTNAQCLYDQVFTENPDLALETALTEEASEDSLAVVANQVPSISVKEGARLVDEDYYVDATVGQAVTIVIETNDTADDTVTVSADTNTVGATLTVDSDGTVSVTFTLTDTHPVSLGLIGTDNIGAHSAVLDIVIVACSGCNSPQGTCDFTNYVETEVINNNFFVAECTCLAYWDGANCETDFDACTDSTCLLGQNCTDTLATDQMADNSLPGFTCTPCPTGFVANGTKCDDINECSDPSVCTNAACVNTEGSYLCRCNSGFRQGSSFDVCSDIDECAISTDNCDQICTNTAGGFTCECYSGYTRNATTATCDQDVVPSVCDGQCSNAAGCIETDTRDAACFCNGGYELENSTDLQSSCKDIDECRRGDTCSQDCSNTVGGFTCSCYIGYSLEDDLVTCSPCDYPTYGANCASTCLCGSGSTGCDPVSGCICAAGWQGTNCGQDINECDDPNTCSGSNEICVNSVGSYSCECSAGFRYQDLGSGNVCSDIDECLIISDNDCQQTCINTVGSFTCGCRAGYNVDPNDLSQCQDIDECTEGISECSQLCINVAGRYNCECYEGFVLAPDRKLCIKEADMCLLFNTKNCSDICVVENSQPVCKCNTGYELGADDQTCIDINECNPSLTLNRCTDPDSCLNSDGGYTCSCDVGFRLENDQRTCTVCDALHYGVNCATPCNCGQGASHCDSVEGCKCKDGWTGVQCNIDRNECEATTNPCTGDNSVCVNQPGTYACGCAAGYFNNSGVCEDVNECASPSSNPCSQVCTNTVGGYECSCNSGFLKNGDSCEDIDECRGQHGCEQLCENVIGSYRCQCEADFKLTDDKRTCTPINVCADPTICQGTGSSCVNRSGVDTCVCQQGYEFDTNSQTLCVDVKECALVSLNACNQACIEEAGGYSCTCNQPGYYLDVDDVTCIACEEGFYGTGCSSSCTCEAANTESCNHVDGTCTCLSGWKGATCTEDINECDNNPCPSLSACLNTLGSYMCQCIQGYEKVADGSCQGCDSTHFGHNCGSTCTCVTANTADCVDDTGDCVCNTGWKGSTCADNVDECTELTDVCNDTLKTCQDKQGSYDCLCIDGYVINSDSVCIDFDECLQGTHSCSAPQQKCVNEPGTYSCICATGYSLNGGVCTACAAGTWGVDCSQTCSCNVTNTEGTCDAVSGCICKTGWKGVDCSEDVNECTDNTATCPANSQCVNNQGGYECPCNTGYLDTAGSCTLCNNNTHGDNCTVVCDCVANNSLSATQTCDPLNGNCLCKPEWESPRCESDFDECTAAVDPCPGAFEGCHNLGPNDGKYMCSCVYGYVRDSTTNECVLSTATTTTPKLPVGRVRVSMYIVLNLTVDNISTTHNLTITQTRELYVGYAHTGLTAFFEDRMGSRFVEVTILFVEEGSLKVNFTVEIVDTTEDKQAFAAASYKLASGETVRIDNQNTSTTFMSVGGQNVDITAVTEGSLKCLAYTKANGACPTNEECVLVDGLPECQIKKKSDNLALILGLGVGIPLFFIAVLVIGVIVMLYLKNKRKYRSEDFDRTTFNRGFFPAVVPTKINTWGKSDPVYGPYGWDQQSQTSFETSSSEETHKKRRHRRRGEPRDEYAYDNQNNFSWDFLYNYIAPNERYEIQRPRVDGSRGYKN